MKQVNLCDVAWDLYDKWEKLCEKKESSKTKKTKDLDRQIASAREELMVHRATCEECKNG